MKIETQAKISAARMGKKASPETKSKMSAAHMGHTTSPETRAKLSTARKGKPGYRKSPETRIKLSAALVGCVRSLETRAKISATKTGTKLSLESLAKRWKGGRKVSWAKTRAKRRGFGYVYLNPWFVGCEGHHVDNEQVIHMPHALHRSVYHRQTDGRGMAQINAIAYEYLKQQVAAAIAAKESL